MSLVLSLSALNAASTALDVIGNNIANSQTIGFKTSKARFADLYAASVSGASNSALGAGVNAATVYQQFTQGDVMQSDNPLDMAITGKGFFRLNNGGTITYSRDGQFQLSYDASSADKRVLVNRTGLNVTGYPAEFTTDPKGVIVTTSAPQNISVDTVMPAAATTAVVLGATLDARVAVPVAPFDPNDSLSYTGTAGLTVFDAAGASHDMRTYFVKSAPGNLWNLYSTMDAGVPTGPFPLSFDPQGLLTTAMPLSLGGSPAVTLDLTGTVQYGRPFSVDSITHDGYPQGAIQSSSGFSVGNDGVIQAFYSNGQSRKVAQIVLASFVNPEALINMGDNQWMPNGDPVRGSGVVTLDTPGRSTGANPMGMGTIQGGAKEQSNVDLTTELVAMIEQQRNYQASAQTFKIQDQVLQNLVNAR